MPYNRYWGISKESKGLSSLLIALLWVLCCCGFLPIIGFLKAILVFLPTLVITTVGCTGISLILFPLNVYHSFRTVIMTKYTGINLKLLLCGLLPFLLCIFPFIVFFTSLLIGFAYGLIAPIAYTFALEYNLVFGGTLDVIRDACLGVKYFWRGNYEILFDALKEIREGKPNGAPFDIKIIQTIIAFFFGLLGSLVDGIGVAVIGISKIVPFTLKVYYHVGKFTHEYYSVCLEKSILGLMIRVALFPFIVASFILIPFITFLLLIIVILLGFIIGLGAAFFSYIGTDVIEGSISSFFYMAYIIFYFDILTNEFIVNKKLSCLPCFDLNPWTRMQSLEARGRRDYEYSILQQT